MSAGSDESEVNWLGLVFVVIVIVGLSGWYFWPSVSNTFHRVFHTSNSLEKVTAIGVATRQQYQQFKDDGGINKEDSWHGFHVSELNVGFDKADKLKLMEVVLFKVSNGYRDATITNLKGALSEICGSEWERAEGDKGMNLLAKKGNCLIMDSNERPFINLSVGKL